MVIDTDDPERRILDGAKSRIVLVSIKNGESVLTLI